MNTQIIAVVTLTVDDFREAIVKHIADQCAGDGPIMHPEDVEFFLADGKSYSGDFTAIATQQ